MLLVIVPETRTHVPSAASQTAGCSSVLPTTIFYSNVASGFFPCDFKRKIISLLSHIYVLNIVEGFHFRSLTSAHIPVFLRLNHVDKLNICGSVHHA